MPPHLQGKNVIRAGSFFSKSHLTLQQWMMLIHYWSRQNSVCDAAESSGVGKNTAIDVYQWLREVCSTRLINDGPVRLGGPGMIVQIDESLFRHKQKVPVPVYYYTVVQHVLPTIVTLTVSSWKTSPTGGVGIWVGRYVTSSCQGVYASGGHKGYQYSPPTHQGTYIARDSHSF